MEDQTVEKKDWRVYFDCLTKGLRECGKQVEIEVVGLDVGDQIEEEWIALEGITYDPVEDILRVHTAPLDHAILRPQTIMTHGELGQVDSIGIRDEDGRLQVLNLREPVSFQMVRSA